MFLPILVYCKNPIKKACKQRMQHQVQSVDKNNLSTKWMCRRIYIRKNMCRDSHR